MIKELQKKRDDYQVSIRKQNINSKITIMRYRLLSCDSSQTFLSRYRNIIRSGISLTEVLRDMRSQLQTCSSNNLTILCLAATDVLLQFRAEIRDKANINDFLEVGKLLFANLGEDQKECLACQEYVEWLCSEMVDSWQSKNEEIQSLFDIALQMTMHTATQSERLSYKMELAAQRLIHSKSDYQYLFFKKTLLIALMHCPVDCLKTISKQRLKNFSKFIYRIYATKKQQSHVLIHLIREIGCFIGYRQDEREIFEFVINQDNSMDDRHGEGAMARTNLYFLKQQTKITSWLTYRQVRDVLKLLSARIIRPKQIVLFLQILKNIIINQHDQQTTTQIYIDYFQNRIRYFLIKDYASIFAQLLSFFISLQGMNSNQELITCLLQCMKAFPQRVDFFMRANFMVQMLHKNRIHLHQMGNYFNQSQLQKFFRYLQSNVNKYAKQQEEQFQRL